MRDQRVEARPALGLENARNGSTVGCIGSQPVDGLGRNGDHLARFDHGQRSRFRFLALDDLRHVLPSIVAARAYNGYFRIGTLVLCFCRMILSEKSATFRDHARSAPLSRGVMTFDIGKMQAFAEGWR